MSLAPLITASVSCKGFPGAGVGTLVLTTSALVWSTNGQPPFPCQIPVSSLESLHTSKEGSAKIQLLVKFAIPPIPESKIPDGGKVTFTFTAASSAISDRQKFIRDLTPILAKNRGEPAAAAVAAGGGPVASSSTDVKGKGKERAVQLSPEDMLRKSVLEKNQHLRELHLELVIRKKMLSEAEFWDGREDVLETARAEEGMKKGRSGEMVDPKPETGDNGEVTVKITPALIKDIFEEYPAVLRAYNDNVPKPLDEQSFWTRYFQSKLFNRNRSTNRAAVNTIKDDPIFDLYLGEEDDDLEPKNLKPHEIYRLLDLAATEEDQHEVSNQADYTMRAGGQRASLPLMRRFNEHSERLLNQSLGASESRRDAMGLNPGDAGARNALYDSILLDDLTTTTTEDRILLHMQDRTNVAKSADTTEDGSSMTKDEERNILRQVKRKVREWDAVISEVELDSQSVAEAVLDMQRTIALKVDKSSTQGTGSIPERTFRELSTIQSSANEFLRQFWAAVLPSKPGDAPLQPSVKAAKAERMKGCLEKSEERAREVVKGLSGSEVEKAKVEAALQPVLEAVANAIAYYQSRLGPRT